MALIFLNLLLQHAEFQAQLFGNPVDFRRIDGCSSGRSGGMRLSLGFSQSRCQNFSF